MRGIHQTYATSRETSSRLVIAMSDNLRVPPHTEGVSVPLEGAVLVLIAAEHPTSTRDRFRLGVIEDDYFPHLSDRYNLGQLVAALRYAQQLQGGGLNLKGEVSLCFCRSDNDGRRPLAVRIGDSRTVLIVDPAGAGGDE